jgi:hypothetical protein
MSAELKEKLDSTTLAQFQARQIVKASLFMAKFVESTREDKLRWRPSTEESSCTRSVLEQVGECIFANIRFRHFLQGETAPAPPADWDSFTSAADAVSQLRDSADRLAVVIAAMDNESLSKNYTTHRGPMPGALAIQFPLRNMTYHIGQINMIQLLYGDKEFHIDEEFVTL